MSNTRTATPTARVTAEKAAHMERILLVNYRSSCHVRQVTSLHGAFMRREENVRELPAIATRSAITNPQDIYFRSSFEYISAVLSEIDSVYLNRMHRIS